MFLLPLQLFQYFYPAVTNETHSVVDDKEFLIQQTFSLPKPIINYLWKNIESPNVYQKLIESCKYFNSKKSCVLLKSIRQNQQNKWLIKTFKDSTCRTFNFDIWKYNDMKIWITEALEIRGFDNNFNTASEIMPKIYRCDAEKLFLSGQVLFFNEFIRLTSKVEECYIYICYKKYEINEQVPFEVIFESLPAIKEFEYKFSETATNFDFETMEKVMRLPNFQGIEIFELISIPTNFDILPFYNSMKETKSCKQFSFYFRDGMPEGFQNQIIAINDEILMMMKSIDFVFPYMSFPEYDDELDKFLDIFQQYKSREYTPRVIKKKECVFIVADTLFWVYLFLGRPNMDLFVPVCSSIASIFFIPAFVFLPRLIIKVFNSFI